MEMPTKLAILGPRARVRALGFFIGFKLSAKLQF